MLWKQGSKDLILENSHIIKCSCEVRNELNGRRGGNQIIRSIPDGRPYMPRIFPVGEWNVSQPEARTLSADRDKYPWYIPTDAWQMLPEWSLDPEGRYYRPTDRMVRDSGYGLHWCIWSKTTLGCIRIASMGEVELLVTMISAALKNNESVKLKVE